MYLQSTFEFALILGTDKFQKLLKRATESDMLMPSSGEDEYVDTSLVSKGLTIIYRDKQYKKKVKLLVNLNILLDGSEPDQGSADKLIRKLEKRIDSYFCSKYTLDDFNLNRMILVTNIDVNVRDNVTAYIKVLQRVGKIKGFSPLYDNSICDDFSYCLDGNSNGIEFMICDLVGLLHAREAISVSKELKAIAKKAEGLLRAEVRLVEPRAIRKYTDEVHTSDQAAELCSKVQEIFLDTFTRVIPFGDFHKKDKTVEIIKQNVSNSTIKRRMLRLVELIPEKKSLLLAQKALNYRHVDDVMKAFTDIKVAPVTISKRYNIKKLDNLYHYL